MRSLLTRIHYRFANHVESLRRPLSTADPQIHDVILAEKKRQFTGINLIASENYCSNACLAAVGSVLNNKYA
jgi:glycine hydroxymethyltransferase